MAKRVAAGWAPPRGWRPAWPTVRSLKRCVNTAFPERGASFHDRDVNAARCILAAFNALDRGDDVPAWMRRGTHATDAEQRTAPFLLVPHVQGISDDGDDSDSSSSGRSTARTAAASAQSAPRPPPPTRPPRAVLPTKRSLRARLRQVSTGANPRAPIDTKARPAQTPPGTLRVGTGGLKSRRPFISLQRRAALSLR